MFLIYYYCVTFIHYSWSLRALLAVLVVPSSIIYCAVCPMKTALTVDGKSVDSIIRNKRGLSSRFWISDLS
uniref:Uncharacterized protein n=1 Tax=Arundo donax TaxID=35708 RepID=A0A0A9CDU7_ARUDO